MYEKTYLQYNSNKTIAMILIVNRKNHHNNNSKNNHFLICVMTEGSLKKQLNPPNPNLQWTTKYYPDLINAFL